MTFNVLGLLHDITDSVSFRCSMWMVREKLGRGRGSGGGSIGTDIVLILACYV